MKNIRDIDRLLTDKEFTTKVKLFFSSKSAGDDYDPYEGNYTLTNLNPKTIKAYVREITPEALVYKQYGLDKMGAKEIICDKKYRAWFENCSKILIDNKEYQVYREGVGQNVIIAERPANLLRVAVTRKV